MEHGGSGFLRGGGDQVVDHRYPLGTGGAMGERAHGVLRGASGGGCEWGGAHRSQPFGEHVKSAPLRALSMISSRAVGETRRRPARSACTQLSRTAAWCARDHAEVSTSSGNSPQELRAADIVEHSRGGYGLTAEGRRLLDAYPPINAWAERWAARSQQQR